MIQRKRKGSALIFALFIMSISLIIGIGLMSSSSITGQSVASSAKSVNSFQVADNGVEYAFDLLNDYAKDNITATPTSVEIPTIFNITGECNNDSGGTIKKTNPDGSFFEIELFDSSGHKLNCESGGKNVGQISTIKSVGTFNNISRSVEASGLNLTSTFSP